MKPSIILSASCSRRCGCPPGRSKPATAPARNAEPGAPAPPACWTTGRPATGVLQRQEWNATARLMDGPLGISPNLDPLSALEHRGAHRRRAAARYAELQVQVEARRVESCSPTSAPRRSLAASESRHAAREPA